MEAEKEKVTSLRKLLHSILESKQADLHDILKHGSLESFAQLMLSAKLITKEVNDKPDFNNILGSFKALMNWQETQVKLNSHCCKFLDVLERLGFDVVAQTIKEAWMDGAYQQLGITLILVSSRKPQQVKQGSQPSPVFQGGFCSPFPAQSRHLHVQGHAYRAPPLPPPKSSYELHRNLRRNSNLRQKLTAKVAQNQQQKSNTSLNEMWSQEVNGQIHSQPLPTHDGYNYLETIESSEGNANVIWLPWQSDSSPNSSLHGGMVLVPNDANEDNIQYYTDPLVLVRGGDDPISDHYNEHYSENIQGSDVLLPYYDSMLPSRSSTDDTVTPLILNNNNTPHPLSNNPRPPRLPLTHGRPSIQNNLPMANITSPSSGQTIRPQPQSFNSENPLADASNLPNKLHPTGETLSHARHSEIARPYSQEDKDVGGEHNEIVSGSSHSTNAAAIRLSEELVLIKTRLSKLEADDFNKSSCTRCIEQIHERDKRIAVLEAELRQKTAQFSELKGEKSTQLKISLAILLIILFVFVVIILAIVMTKNTVISSVNSPPPFCLSPASS